MHKQDILEICFLHACFQGNYIHSLVLPIAYRSDSVSTIGVLKDVITKEATNVKMNLSINVEVREEPAYLDIVIYMACASEPTHIKNHPKKGHHRGIGRAI